MVPVIGDSEGFSVWFGIHRARYVLIGPEGIAEIENRAEAEAQIAGDLIGISIARLRVGRGIKPANIVVKITQILRQSLFGLPEVHDLTLDELEVLHPAFVKAAQALLLRRADDEKSRDYGSGDNGDDEVNEVFHSIYCLSLSKTS